MSEFHRATFNRRIEARIPFSSLLVVESVGEQGLTNNGDLAMKQALREVVSVLKNERTDQASLLEILTGVRTQVEAFAAELAHQESLSLCLLSVGKPCSLTESQKLAQHQIWLGAEVDDIKTGQPQSIRNEVALGYAEKAKKLGVTVIITEIQLQALLVNGAKPRRLPSNAITLAKLSGDKSPESKGTRISKHK